MREFADGGLGTVLDIYGGTEGLVRAMVSCGENIRRWCSIII